ncbi:proline dehydrogenase family protein [Ohtaekwangia koreensis]|uniref:L-proline dehydrogenase n=1 Tax=Ohtaekwangia koreensis TaxID=688867 RepID=A0A1T5MKQ0_9BACT|nr:proline dehydrogenase family protein [Ohtaekwangia koreensis]SKC88787.1 L-proline dehydrogenase [Ohtaekwangia koreensis]
MEEEPRISFEDTSVAFSYKSDAALRKANFIFSMVNHPWISAAAIGSVKFALKLHLPVEGIIRKTAFDHFCGGISIDNCDDEIAQLSKYGVGTILDYSVEGEKSEKGFDQVTEEIIRTIDKAKGDPAGIPFSVFKVTGLGDSDLFEKIQREDVLTIEEQRAFERVRQRVDKICARAHANKIPVLIDAEETWIQEPIDTLAYEMMAKYNKEKAIVFNTYQLYRIASLQNLKNSFEEAARKNYYIGAKLVRGAYMEKERARAEAMGYPDPIQPDKAASDKAFNEALEFCVENISRIAFMCGSHNEESNLYLTTLMHKYGLKNTDDRIWFAQLYGMSDNISFNLAKAGYKVAKYVPYGPVRSVMPYLFRRAQENTSVAGQSSRELILIRKELERRKRSRK